MFPLPVHRTGWPKAERGPLFVMSCDDLCPSGAARHLLPACGEKEKIGLPAQQGEGMSHGLPACGEKE